MFSNVEIPREYIDPSNFRLHPKGFGYSHNSNNNDNLVISISGNKPILNCDIVEDDDRTVTVYRIGDSQKLRIKLSGDFKVII